MSQRLIAALNVGLGVCLITLIAMQGRRPADVAPVSPTELTSDRVQTTLAVPHELDRPVELRFGAAMIPAEAVGDPVPSSLLRLSPPLAGEPYWLSTNRIVLAPLADLRRATTYDLHLDPELESMDGGSVAGSAQHRFTTPSVRWTDRSIVDTEDERPTARLTFDLPVEEKDLRAVLHVARTDGTPLPYELTAAPEPGLARDDAGTSFLLSLPIEQPPLDVAVVNVRRGLTSSVGPVATDSDQVHEFRFREPLQSAGMRAYSEFIELSFSHDVPLPAEGAIELVPARPFQVHRKWGDLRLVGAFEPGEVVTVRLAEGFPGTGRRRLERAVERSLRVPDLRPNLEFAQRGEILSSLAYPELEVRGVNVDAYEVRVETLYENNLVRLLGRAHRAPAEAFRPAKRRTVEVAAVRNESFVDRVNLRELLGEDPRGIHRVRMRRTEPRGSWSTRIVQVTDLATTVRAGRDAVVVRVGSLARGNAVSKAAVEVYAKTNQLLSRGETDAEGLVRLPFRPGGDRVPAFVVVRHAEDLTFLDLERHGVELAGEEFAGRPHLQSGGFEAWVWSPQGVARPGEALRATILVRGARGIAADGLPIRVTWTAPDGRVRRTREHALPADGLLVSEYATTTGDPTGAWRCGVELVKGDVRIGGTTTLLDTVIPDRLETELTLPERLVAGSTVEVAVEGRWLDGGLAAGRPVRLSTRLDRGSFRPEGWSEFEFEAAGDATPPGALRDLTGVLDDRGRAVFRVRLPEAASHQSLRATFVAEVEDPGGRPARGVAERTVLPPHHLLGLRVTNDGAEAVVVDPDGVLWPEPVDLQLRVLRRSWSWSLAEGRNGRWSWQCEAVTQLVREVPLTVRGGRARIALDLAEPEDGWLVLAVSPDDHKGANPLTIEVAGTPEPQSPDRVRLTPPQEAVTPGTTVELPIASPVTGLALVTIEGRTVHTASVQRVQAGQDTLEVALPPGLEESSVHAMATVWVPQAREGRPGPVWLVGGCPIALAHPERVAEVHVVAPAEVRPETTVEVQVTAPGARRAVVALVDEGVLRLTQHPSPDPAAWFGARRRLMTRGADTGTSLMDAPRFDPGILFGGDEDSMGAARTAALAAATLSHIRTIALVSDTVQLDADGAATVSFELPPYEGRLRAMVVAAGASSVGGASEPITVTAPLGLQGSGPRALVPGDRSEAVFTLRNRTESVGTVELTVTASAGLELSEAPPAVVELAPGRVHDLVLPLVRTDEGSGVGTVTVEAVGLGETRTAEVAIGLSQPGTFTRRWQFGSASEGATLEVDEGWIGPVRTRVSASTRPAESLRAAVRELVRYPYGCVEQTTSRGFALLAATSLLPEGDTTAANSREYLQAAVDRLLAMQRSDGSFGWWPGSGGRYDFGTVYATDLLLAARDEGCEVQAQALADAGRATARVLNHTADLGLRCYAVDVASRAGRPVDGWLDRLGDDVQATEDRARLARALHRVGRTSEAREQLAQAQGGDAPEREFDGYLRSPLRTDAALLAALLDVAPTDSRVSSLVQRCTLALREPERRTTQELGQCLRVLGDFHGGRGGSEAPFSGTLTHAGATSALAEGVVELDLHAGESVSVAGERGVVWFELLGHRQAEPRADLPGFRVERTVIDLATGRPATEFRRGGRYEVRLTGHGGGTRQLLIQDRLPAGLEIESALLARPSERPRLSPWPAATEGRDDRQTFFFEQPVDEFELAYRVRAVVRGRYAAAALQAECMYGPELVHVAPRQGTVVIER